MSDQPEETWKDIPGFPGYQADRDGRYRSLDRTLASGRRVKGKTLATRPNNRGYLLVDLRDAEGNKVTRSAHTVTLETHAGACPPGMEARHLDDDPRRNTWRPGREDESRAQGGNLFWGTKEDNHRDKVRNGGAKPPPGPAFDCVNHERCRGKVANEGRRCLPCVEQVGRDAADMLRRGENLLKVVQHFGYSGTRWTYQIAVRHGGFQGTEAQALTQHRSWSRRVAATVRERLPRRRAASPASPPDRDKGERNPRPRALRAVSPQGDLGHSGHSRTPNVAERNNANVTERNHVPYPADSIQRDRPSRASGGTTRRSR